MVADVTNVCTTVNYL